MPIPQTTRWNLERRLQQHRQQHWPNLTHLSIRYRANFAHITADPDGDPLPLCRLRYLATPTTGDSLSTSPAETPTKNSLLPTGTFTGTPEDALDCACNLYLTN
jgi:hypothetical protein